MRTLAQISHDMRLASTRLTEAEDAGKIARAHLRMLREEYDTAFAATMSDATPDSVLVANHGKSTTALDALTDRVTALHPAFLGVTHWTHADEQPQRIRRGARLALAQHPTAEYLHALRLALIEFANRFCPDLPALDVEEEVGMVLLDLLHRDEGRIWQILYQPSLTGRAIFRCARWPEEGRVEGNLGEVLAHACAVAGYRD